MIVGCYDLHLYCSRCNQLGQATGAPQTYAKAMQEMTKRGWKPTLDGEDVLCPECAKRRLARS